MLIANCRHFEAFFPTHNLSTKSSCSQCLGTNSPGSQLLYALPVHDHPSCDAHLYLSSLQKLLAATVLQWSHSLHSSHPSIHPSIYPYIHSSTLCAQRLGSTPGCPGYGVSATGCSRLPMYPSPLRHHKLLHSQLDGEWSSGDYERNIPRSQLWLYNFPLQHLKSVLVKEPGMS